MKKWNKKIWQRKIKIKYSDLIDIFLENTQFNLNTFLKAIFLNYNDNLKFKLSFKMIIYKLPPATISVYQAT